MRIVININTSWNIYNFRKGLLRFLIAQGHEIYAVAPEDNYSPRLEALGCRYIPVKLDNKGVNPLKDLKYFYHLYQIYASIRPQVVLHYTIKPNIYGTLAAKLLGIPVINNVSGLGTAFLRKDLGAKIARLLYRLAFRFPAKVFFQNSQDKALFVEQNLVAEARTALLPGSGICLESFRPQPQPSAKGFVFLLIARLIYDKGIREYVEAIRLLRKQGIEARFQLLGAFEKDPRNKLNIAPEQVAEWQREGLIEYLGSTEQVQPFIAQAHCIVLPSYREGTPRVLLEAASMARPLVASDVPGCREVLMHEENGFLCEVQNAQSLADAMLRMYSVSEEERLQMGLRGREKMEKEFDEQLVIALYAAAIESLSKNTAQERLAKIS